MSGADSCEILRSRLLVASPSNDLRVDLSNRRPHVVRVARVNFGSIRTPAKRFRMSIVRGQHGAP